MAHVRRVKLAIELRICFNMSIVSFILFGRLGPVYSMSK